MKLSRERRPGNGKRSSPRHWLRHPPPVPGALSKGSWRAQASIRERLRRGGAALLAYAPADDRRLSREMKRVAILISRPLVLVEEMRASHAAIPPPADVALDFVLVEVIRDLAQAPVIQGAVSQTTVLDR